MSRSGWDLVVRRSSLVLGFTMAAVASALVAGGCTGLSWYDYHCEDFSECPGNNCPGECVPLPPLGFDGPSLLWVGPETEAPECPTRAPRKVFEGHADLDTSHQCPVCECSPPVCLLPGSVTISDQPCAGSGGVQTEIDTPPFWNGSCVPAAGGPPSPRSVTIGPMTELPCAPVAAAIPADAPVPWRKVARACEGEVVDTVCNDPGLTCVPTAAPPPPGFRQCISWIAAGEPQCPTEYPDRVDTFESLDDTRGCTPCECTQTSPSACSAVVSMYQNATCNAFLNANTVTTDPVCLDIPAGMSLASMKADPGLNLPGACQASGGVPFGDVVPVNPRVFCCEPLADGSP